MRITIYIKNAISSQLLKASVSADQMLAFIPRLTADEVFSLPASVSIFLAVAVGKIINRKTDGSQ